MQSSDVVLIARRRAGLTQQQLAARSGHARETIARWETGTREPTLASLRSVVGACGLELVVTLAEGDDSLGGLIDDQLAVEPTGRLTRLLPEGEATDALRVLEWLAAARSSTIVVGGMAAALQGGPQRPGDGQVEVVAADPLGLTIEMSESELSPTDSHERFADTDRRWPWTLPGGGTLVLAGGLPGSTGYADLKRSAEPFAFGAGTVRVAHPRDLLRLAEASVRQSERARVPALRALLSRRSSRA